jgi:hypothetical protein
VLATLRRIMVSPAWTWAGRGGKCELAFGPGAECHLHRIDRLRPHVLPPSTLTFTGALISWISKQGTLPQTQEPGSPIVLSIIVSASFLEEEISFLHGGLLPPSIYIFPTKKDTT